MNDKEIQFTQSPLPCGVIVMWYGTIATIPAGWALCNGSNGTPDLRDQFIIGASADSGGQAKTFVRGSYEKTGGAVYHSHVLDESYTFVAFGNYWNSSTNVVDHLPPFYALAFIMKL